MMALVIPDLGGERSIDRAREENIMAVVNYLD
jgi:hypothetical protein